MHRGGGSRAQAAIRQLASWEGGREGGPLLPGSEGQGLLLEATERRAPGLGWS